MMFPSGWRGLPALASTILFSFTALAAAGEGREMLSIPGGKLVPFFVSRRSTDPNRPPQPRRAPVHIPPFLLDRYPVTNAAYLKFIEANPKWSKSAIVPLFADPSYLKSWPADLDFGEASESKRPITQISWYAAKAYCQWKGKSLPTTDQWEYVTQDRKLHPDEARKKILEWYGKPNRSALPEVGSNPPNSFGVHDLLGVIWEWTLDFNSTIIGAEIRDSGVKDEDLFCGAGSLGALDPSDYATFMRFSFRASLSADFTTTNLGFRCAKEIKK